LSQWVYLNKKPLNSYVFKIFLKYYSRVKKRKEEEKIEEEILKSLKQQLNKAQNHLVALEELIVIEFR
jgi:hypothetical protein